MRHLLYVMQHRGFIKLFDLSTLYLDFIWLWHIHGYYNHQTLLVWKCRLWILIICWIFRNEEYESSILSSWYLSRHTFLLSPPFISNCCLDEIRFHFLLLNVDTFKRSFIIWLSAVSQRILLINASSLILLQDTKSQAEI